MWVKICANTTLHDAQMAVDAGADAVGFVFAPSMRRVTTEQAAEIVEALPAGVDTVGVFATDEPYEVNNCVASAGLTIAQLHRPFDARMVRLLSAEFGGELKIIQTVAYEVDSADPTAADRKFVQAVRAVSNEPAVWAVLIDAAQAGKSGGLGVAFDWTHVNRLVREAAPADARVILAGGLRQETVGEAIRQFVPWGVDVASGVEAAAGKKDGEKVRAFVQRARA